MGWRAIRRPAKTGKSSEPIWGTPYYLAPEKLLGQNEDHRSDIYSLGATLFHALAGRPPFEAATAGEVLAKHATQPVFSLKTYAPDTHDKTAQVIGRMLAKNPADRYATYDALIRDLEAALTEMRTAAAQKTIVAPTGERVPVSSIIGTVIGLLVCGVAGFFFWQKFLRTEPTKPPVPPPVPTTQTTPATNTATTPPPVTVNENDVDFTADASWVNSWNVATQRAAAGQYNNALLSYDEAKSMLQTRPKHRQWIFFYQGLTLLAADRQAEARPIFQKAWDIEPLAKSQVPESITTRNFVDPLVHLLATSFWFDAEIDPKNRRNWCQIEATAWLERYATGERSLYKVVEHSEVDSVPGTIVRRNDEAVDVFIPDAGSKSRVLKLRPEKATDWQALGTMQDPGTGLKKAIEHLPPWAAGLARLCLGFKLRDGGQFQAAAESFRAYTKVEHPDEQKWAFALQPLAEKLAGDCDGAAATLDSIDKLKADDKPEEALTALHAAVEKTTSVALKTALTSREASLQEALKEQKDKQEMARLEAERLKREQEEMDRKLGAKEVTLVQAVDPETVPLYQNYEFGVALAKYEACTPKVKTVFGKKALDVRLTIEPVARGIQNATDGRHRARPYERGDLMTRNGKPLADKLVRATEGQLVFKTKYGDVLIDWRDLAPSYVTRLGEFYATAAAATDKPDAVGRRYLALAVFARQFGADRAATAYAQQAVQLLPDLQKEVTLIFAKPEPEEKPETPEPPPPAK